MRPLSRKQRDDLAGVLAGRPEVVRALFVSSGERPALVFEYDERPATVETARKNIQELVAAVAPVLGRSATTLGFAAGGPGEVARIAPGGEVVFERR
jgi:hypothetical protein